MATFKGRDKLLGTYGRYRALFWGLIGVILSIVGFYSVSSAEYPMASYATAMIILMAVWWIFEVVPIAMTSLIPLLFLPFVGLMDMREVGTFYGRPIIFLFLGGFLLAIGLKKSGVHKRIALFILKVIGEKPSSIVLGFMIASAFLSMWISNTASVLVMLPIALSILEQVKPSGSEKGNSLFGVTLMLGIAYAADIGGMATLIGTPPNLVFLELYNSQQSGFSPIGFLDWMILVLPMSILFLIIGWFILTRFIYPLKDVSLSNTAATIDQHRKALGALHRDEFFAGLVFLIAVVLWVTGSDIQLGQTTIHGWRSIFGLELVSDAVVAIGTSFLLFLIPSKDRNGERILSWNDASEVPWGILLLFGGGFALAGAFNASGLATMTAEAFTGIEGTSTLATIGLVSTVITFLTEITSNTAMANLILPVLANVSEGLSIDPRLLMIPATLSASCAFMMPVASPTQAIIFGSGYVSIKQMVKAGLWFNLLGIILVTVVFYFWGRFILGI